MFDLATAATATQGSFWASFAPLLLVFVLFYFLLIRPQQKKTKKRNQMLSAIKKNDRVITIGGIHGTIVDLTDDTVTLRVNENSKLTFDRSAVNAVTSSDEVENA